MARTLASVALLVLALLPLAAVADNDITTPKCMWRTLDGGEAECLLSPAYMVSKLATTIPNAFAKLMVQTTANVLHCNNITDMALCNADSGCTYDQTLSADVPRCTNKDMSDASYTDVLSCPGSIMSTVLPCQDANDEASCTAAAAKGGACTWFADGNTCQANYTLSLADDAARQEFNNKVTAFNASVWGDCDSFKAYVKFATACTNGSSSVVTPEACASLGATCQWFEFTDYGACSHSAIAPLLMIFGLNTTNPIVIDQQSCASAVDAASCAANTTNVTMSQAVFDAARDGLLAINSDVEQIVNTTTTTSTVGDNATAAAPAKTGGAATVRAAPAAVAGALLLAALLL